MAKVVIIVDSATGQLVDVAGNGRESGRYERFAKRMLSLANNPELDYGCNGGDTLTISKGGVNGAAINLMAATVNISGTLKVNGRTIQEIASGQADVLDSIRGKKGEVEVSSEEDADTGKEYLLISLDASVANKLTRIEELVDDMDESASRFVSKDDLLDAIGGISVTDSDTLDDVRGKLSLLIRNLVNIAGRNEEQQDM